MHTKNLPSSLPPAARCAPPSTEPQAPPTHPHVAKQALAAKLELVRVCRTPGFSLPAPLQDPTTAKKTSKPAPGTRCAGPVCVCFASDTRPVVSTLPPAGGLMEDSKPAMSCKTIPNHPASLFHCGSVHPVFSDTERAALSPDQILGRPCQLSLSSSALRRTVQPPGAGGPIRGVVVSPSVLRHIHNVADTSIVALLGLVDIQTSLVSETLARAPHQSDNFGPSGTPAPSGTFATWVPSVFRSHFPISFPGVVQLRPTCSHTPVLRLD